MPTNPVKLTLDTNCIINMFDASSKTATSVDELFALMRLGMDGRAQIAITTRVEDDLLTDKVEGRRTEMLRMLQAFPVISSIGRRDMSAGDADVWAAEHTSRSAEEIQRMLFPGLQRDQRKYSNSINDVYHLIGHMIGKRDIFATNDITIFKNAEGLCASFGIVVMKPSGTAAYIDDMITRRVLRTLPSAETNPAYHSRALSGTATFDYSNNNHLFAIGEGHWLFETKWTKGGNTAIHAYSDAPSIEAIALAKGADKIADLADAAAYDFSSRTRSPKLGQILIWRNVIGLYAATRVVSIKDDSRGAEHDELTFEYVILPSGVNFAG